MKSSVCMSLLAVFALFSCKKVQPELDATKNCDCAKEVSADFRMGEMYGDQFIDLDTIAMPINFMDGNPANFDYVNLVYVHFSADIENALSYEWQVGSNSNVQTVKDFGLYFNDTIGTIPVRLIVHAKPNSICFPNDDGIDTIIRYLTIRNLDPDPLAGSYYGYNTNDPGNYFTIIIDTATQFVNGFGNACGFGIKNLPEGNNKFCYFGREQGSQTLCITGAGFPTQPYSSSFVLYDENSNLFSESTTGIYDPQKNELIINYYSAPVINNLTLGTPFPKRTFIGKKI